MISRSGWKIGGGEINASLSLPGGDWDSFQEETLDMGSRFLEVAQDAGKNPKLPPFFFSSIAVLLILFFLFELIKNYVAGFLRRTVLRVLAIVLCFWVIGVLGKFFIGDEFEEWVDRIVEDSQEIEMEETIGS